MKYSDNEDVTCNINFNVTLKKLLGSKIGFVGGIATKGNKGNMFKMQRVWDIR